ncbi:MAG: hypothetical protein K5864_06200 [Bacteroidales bacterium]|nr:hypothetical protein [Bacteroidales bacterium]
MAVVDFQKLEDALQNPRRQELHEMGKRKKMKKNLVILINIVNFATQICNKSQRGSIADDLWEVMTNNNQYTRRQQ